MTARAGEPLTMVAVGDVRLARRGYRLSFAGVADIITSADVAFFNQEGTYAQQGPYDSLAYYNSRPNDPSKLPALSLMGFDVCNMASNVNFNWGIGGGIETWELLKAMG